MTDFSNSVTEVKTAAVEKSSSGVAFMLCGKLALLGVLLWVCIRVLLGLRQKVRRRSTATASTAIGANSNITTHTDARRRTAWEREQKRLDELAATALAAKQERVTLQQNTRATAVEANSNATANMDVRRRTAWEREQRRLDELAAAALAAKQERVKLQQNTRAAALALREAKKRALASSRKADGARMRRRRAEDQLRLSGDAHDEEAVRLLQDEAEEAVRQDQIVQQTVEQAMDKLEELRGLLLKET